MFNKSLALILVILMMSPIFMVTNGMVSTTINPEHLESAVMISETDLSRVTVQSNLFPNNGFEDWTDAHNPMDLLTARTTFKDSWYEHSIVFEGSTSFGMFARAMDPSHYSDMYLTNQSQVYWHGATNLTLDVEWYLESIGNPINQDFFRVEFNIDNRNLYYYLGCETIALNTTNYGYYNIQGPLQTWNHLSRNISSDYFEVFGVEPDYYRTMYWRVRSYTNAFTEAYIDDIYLVNGTLIKIGGSVSGGNFEGGGAWTTTSGQGAGDVAQSATTHSGSSSLNLTALTLQDGAYAYAYYQPGKLLTSDNQANLSFWWNLESYSNPSTATWARVTVTVANATFDSNIYYYMFVGGSGTLPMLIFGNDIKFAVSNFNVTGSWNYFDRNIFQDFNSKFETDYLWIDQINIQVRNWQTNSRISLLIDDASFTPSILNDMDYEHQDDVGETIQGWSSPAYPIQATVTDFAKDSTKAMNLTLTDDEQFWGGQSIRNLPIDDTTELILDFNIYIDTFNSSSDDFVFIQLDIGEYYIVYVIANATSAFEEEIGGEYDVKFILLQESVITGEWLNFQRDIVHDYEQLWGSMPDDNLEYFNLAASSDASSQLIVIFDDLYIYYDTAPEITSVEQNPTSVSEAGVTVTISAEVVDATDLTVTLNYRVDEGTWTSFGMDLQPDGSFSYDLIAPYGVTEYFIEAEDAFGKLDTAMDGGEYFTFSTTDSINPVISLLPADGVIVSDIVSIEWNITDTGSGVAWSQLIIEGAEITNTTLDSVGVSWDTTVIANGQYNITILAQDNAGNTATVTHIVNVDNASNALGDLTGALIIVVIIAALGVAFIIYIFVIKKK